MAARPCRSQYRSHCDGAAALVCRCWLGCHSITYPPTSHSSTLIPSPVRPKRGNIGELAARPSSLDQSGEVDFIKLRTAPTTSWGWTQSAAAPATAGPAGGASERGVQPQLVVGAARRLTKSASPLCSRKEGRAASSGMFPAWDSPHPSPDLHVAPMSVLQRFVGVGGGAATDGAADLARVPDPVALRVD